MGHPYYERQMTRKELKDLVDSAYNGLEVAQLLLDRKPPVREGLLHTVLEDVHYKTRKIALEFCAYK